MIMRTSTELQHYPESNQKSPLALRRGMDVVVGLSRPLASMSVEGAANIAELPKDTPAIIATSHGTEFDIPLTVKALGSHLDIAITDQSTHHSLFGEPGMFLSLKLAGDESFIPISYEWEDGKKVPGMFNPEEVTPMISALNRGKNVLVAAFSPITDTKGEPKTPKPGYAAAYLALLTGAPILPVTTSLLPTHRDGRFDALVNIGKPFVLNEELDVSNIQQVMAKRKAGETLSTGEIAELKEQLVNLREAGKFIFNAVTHLEVEDPAYANGSKRKMASTAIKVGHSFIGKLC